jgi:hypothetical protein
MKLNRIVFILLIVFCFSCSSKRTDVKDEQIIAINTTEDETNSDSTSNSISGNMAMHQIPSIPNNVILTGLVNHRLVSIYKQRLQGNTTIVDDIRQKAFYSEYSGSDNMEYTHYMPGIDILSGYKLLNISHYDFATEKQNLFFNKPVLIKTLYYPAFEQDSINKIPVNRNYYLVSVYDEDTNKDTVINKKDLRHFYHFEETATIKTSLLPKDYSVIRSQYDYGKDIMYLYAKLDANKNGIVDKNESLHIFWIDLKNPQKAKRLY